MTSTASLLAVSRQRPRWKVSGGLVVAFALAVSACSSGGSASRATSTSSRQPSASSATSAPVTTPLDWHSCTEGECATLRVPLDAARPAGRTIGLALARASRADPERRIGSLLVNPGGPGGSGVDIVEYVAAQLPSAVTDRFDIVSWDTRGSGRSAPVHCGNDLDARFGVDSSPDDAAELSALEAAAKHVVDQCVADSGTLLRHIASVDTVRDMDAIRAALGDAQLDYLGLSYGTFLGALYAQTYPTHVRALVLDGALDPARSVQDVAIQQAQGFDASLARFFDWCHQRSSCAFHGGGNPKAAFDALVRKIDGASVAVGSRRLGPTQLDLASSALLYEGTAGFRQLASGLHALEGGDGGPLLAISDSYVGRSGGTYDAEWPAFVAIGCADGPNLDLPAMEALQREAAVAAPVYGAGNVGLGYECAYWPYPPTRTAPGPVRAPTTDPILVIGTKGDPATPFAWAGSLAAELGNARLVAVEDATHTATLNGNSCVDGIVTRYLVDLALPAPGTDCR
ncbi:MAG: alpha/beta hydrolase [Acidimicrobiia bacterium]